MKKKAVALLLACMMLLGVAIGGTIAWLTSTTEPVSNVFTVGDINIGLAETTGTEYDYVPGQTLSKDPTVTVKENSEPCWLFVEVVEQHNSCEVLVTSSPINISMAADPVIEWDVIDTPEDVSATSGSTAWTKLDGQNVWYIKIANKTTADTTYPVLTGNQVTVNEHVIKEMVPQLTDATKPTLSFTAYAIQSAYLKNTDGSAADSAAEAWVLVKP